MSSVKEELFAYIEKTYGAQPEYLWMRYPDYAVFRHKDNEKWFALIMDVPGRRLGLDTDARKDILNVKMNDPLWADLMRSRPGFLPGYHISRGNWISILLDGTVPLQDILPCLEESYLTTASREKKKALRAPKSWLVPANPAYYDIVHAFDAADEIDWKQGKGIRPGDTVYMYVGAPVSAVLYKCEVTKTDVPYRYDGEVTIRALMGLKLVKRYPKEAFGLQTLKETYGVYSVRGPRGVPAPLERALEA